MYILNIFSYMDMFDHWALPHYGQAEFGVTSSYLLNVFYSLIYFINGHFCAKPKMWCHIYSVASCSSNHGSSECSFVVAKFFQVFQLPFNSVISVHCLSQATTGR